MSPQGIFDAPVPVILISFEYKGWAKHGKLGKGRSTTISAVKSMPWATEIYPHQGKRLFAIGTPAESVVKCEHLKMQTEETAKISLSQSSA
jgi:hypothetical protein